MFKIYPKAKVRYYASDIILYIDSDATYLVLDKARSRVSGFYYNINKDPKQCLNPPINGPILIECKILRHMVTSAAEAKTAGLFYNRQTAIEIRNILKALNHPRPETPIKTDSSTSASFCKRFIETT